ncbi:probable alpha-glucoside transport protein [Cephalotrichum gorgonifer]|uniref:Probable alpha-glucoside transport protein n=1 Tax=Cephalotrichum gorgonifer TaxID=2041049 RepID=A0AAE8MYJ2_9PEZI|nr:probable alpha-glucoside transport protein [Cephalotrichum gorgonifer]
MKSEISEAGVAHDEVHDFETAAKQTVGQDTMDQARLGAEAEHNLRPLAAIRKYPWAIFWCLVVSMCVVMEGYDTNLINNFYAYPTFAKKYGHWNEATNNYQLTAPWQAGLSNAAGIGCFFGTLVNGFLVTKFGHIRVLMASLVALTGLIFIVFFAPNIATLLVGELLCGLPWGIFATTAPAYASEVLPMSLRVYMTSWTNMCFIIGQLISAGVMAGLVSNTTEWGYRIPFALQWFWPVILLPVLWFAPDTPWHLVRSGRHEDALKSLARLRPNATEVELRDALGLIVYTNNLEVQMSVGTSIWDCFKGFELRRTEIACVAFAGQILSGLNYAYNSTYFFQQIGLDSKTTYNLNVGGNSMALFATFVSWFCIMPYFGRRTTYLYGMFAMASVLFIIGGLNARTENDRVAMSQAVLTLVWTFIFQLSVGQLGWAIPAEVGSTRLRQDTVCLARNAYAILGVIAGVLQPYFMNPQEWNLKGYTGFIWGGTAFLVFIWAFFRLPETKDRTFEELDILFAKRVSARKFSTYKVEAFRDDAALYKVQSQQSVDAGGKEV